VACAVSGLSVVEAASGSIPLFLYILLVPSVHCTCICFNRTIFPCTCYIKGLELFKRKLQARLS